jgi:hypothetical protein
MKEQQIHKEQKQAYSDSINALRNEAIRAMPEENQKLYETESSSNNKPTKNQKV